MKGTKLYYRLSPSPLLFKVAMPIYDLSHPLWKGKSDSKRTPCLSQTLKNWGSTFPTLFLLKNKFLFVPGYMHCFRNSSTTNLNKITTFLKQSDITKRSELSAILGWWREEGQSLEAESVPCWLEPAGAPSSTVSS